MMAAYPSLRNDQWSDHVTPGMNAGAATPSEGNRACRRKTPIARRTSRRAPRSPTKPMKSARSGCIAVIAEHFEREHRADALAAPRGLARRHLAAHLLGREIGHLLVSEGDEARGQPHARELDQHRDAGGVVVGARRARHAVVM